MSREEGYHLSRIRILTSKITQVCQDIRDIKLRRLLITRSDEKPIVITKHILTNQSDRKNTWGSNRSRPGPPDIHGDRAKDGRGLPLSRVWRRDRDRSGPTRSDGLGDRIPINGHSIRSLTQGTGGVVEVNEHGLGGNPMFNDKVTKRSSDLFQGD